MGQQSVVEAFNNGYTLSQYLPEVVELLKPSLDSGDTLHSALLEGARQWESEQEQTRSSELETIRNTQEHDHER
jgi:hypothetical protein